MAQTAAHLVERVIPWVQTRQWVVSVPIPLRYWMAASQDLTAKAHTIIRTTIGQYYVNQAVTRGIERQKVQPGSVTFIQRFGSARNANIRFHVIVLEGVYLDRTAQGLKPRFVKVVPPPLASGPGRALVSPGWQSRRHHEYQSRPQLQLLSEPGVLPIRARCPGA
jgi:hypothetical protein